MPSPRIQTISGGLLGMNEASDERDIVLRLHGGQLERFSNLKPAYSTLHYVLLFPNGEDG